MFFCLCMYICEFLYLCRFSLIPSAWTDVLVFVVICAALAVLSLPIIFLSKILQTPSSISVIGMHAIGWAALTFLWPNCYHWSVNEWFPIIFSTPSDILCTWVADFLSVAIPQELLFRGMLMNMMLKVTHQNHVVAVLGNTHSFAKK